MEKENFPLFAVRFLDGYAERTILGDVSKKPHELDAQALELETTLTRVQRKLHATQALAEATREYEEVFGLNGRNEVVVVEPSVSPSLADGVREILAGSPDRAWTAPEVHAELEARGMAFTMANPIPTGGTTDAELNFKAGGQT